MLTFSNKRKFSGNFAFSPNSLFFAISKGVQLVVYSNQSLKPIKAFTFIDFIEDIQWSNDSQLILIGLYKRSICEVRSIQNENYKCTIDEPIQGISYSLFSPDSLHILTINLHVTKLTIRSLLNKSLLYINLPKFSKKGLRFSSQGKGNFMALAERKDAKDIIGIYYTPKWACIRRFETEAEDLQDIKWSYDNSSIIVIDTPSICKMLIYDILGNLIQKIDIYQYKLGIKKFEISPNGHLFCLGLFDQTLRIYNSVSYTCMSILEHDKDSLNDNSVNYYKEEAIDKEGKTKYIELKPPIDLKGENIYLKGKNLFNDKLPKIGIGKMAFSYDNNFLATKNENMPNVLFIWDLNLMNLKTVLIHLNEVTYFKWSKNKNMLFISTNNNKLYYFTLDSCKILELAKDFHNKSLTFSYDGRKMIVKDFNSFIVVNIDDNQNNIYETVLEIPYAPEIQEQQGQGEEYDQQRQYEQMEGQEGGQGEFEGEEQAEMMNPGDDQFRYPQGGGAEMYQMNPDQ